jgi:hypothetical protein
VKDRIQRYVNQLFADIYETKQLHELKEEVIQHLTEKVKDFIAAGKSEDEAFQDAISSLGDMSELIDSLKKVSYEKMEEDPYEKLPLNRKHIFGYLVAIGLMLFAIMVAGITYLQLDDYAATISTFMPFFISSVMLFVYLGLTQETKHHYPMKGKRAFLYSLGIGVFLFGNFVSGILYFNGHEMFEVAASFMPFMITSILLLIYLGLTEKSRRKMNEEWQKYWVDYYKDPRSTMLRGSLSGALWIFTVAIFLTLGFLIGFKYSWVIFIFAIGVEILIESYFAKKGMKSS